MLSSWSLLLLLARPALAADGMACLQRADLACAETALANARRSAPTAPATLELTAATAFYEGRYADAETAFDALPGDSSAKILADLPIHETAEATRGFVEARGAGVSVRYSPGVDAVLLDDAVSTLERARRVLDPLFGGGPTHDIVMDLFPDARRFIAASGLPPEAVRTTGVVALSKWTRLLVTSPRALARGYAWKDTVAHEYIHLVVAWRTQDRAPVWLQEGLAKHMEGFWRGETSGHLSAWQQSLLAKAIRSGEFVPFEKFKHSMAYLDSGEEAALAFAQVATMVGYLIERGGTGAVSNVLDAVRDGSDAGVAVALAARHKDFEDFREGWMGHIQQLPLVEERLSALPVVLDGEGGEFADDPLLSMRQDLARNARLGDMLRESGRPQAALIEYGKAQDEKESPSPLLIARRADCYLTLKDTDQAVGIAARGVELYPEFALLQTTYATALEAAGRQAEALVAWQAAHDLNPFNPAVQRAIVRLAEALGQDVLAARHRRYVTLLATGGVGGAAR